MFLERSRIRPDREGQVHRSPLNVFSLASSQNPHQDVPEIRHSESGFNGASGIRLLGGGETAWEGDPDGGDGGGKPGELRDLRKIAGAVGVARHSEKADKVVDVEWASE